MARTAALRPTGETVEEVLARAGTRRPDVEALVALLREVTGHEPPADLAGLGRHRAGKGCLYLPRLAEVDLEVLRRVLERSVAAHRGGPGGLPAGS